MVKALAGSTFVKIAGLTVRAMSFRMGLSNFSIACSFDADESKGRL
jgi:hypothetical protein